MKRAAFCLALLTISSCASRGPVDVQAYQAMSCAELNATMMAASVDISKTSIRQANLDEREISRWLVGGSTIRTKINDRRTAQIAHQREVQSAVDAARRRGNC